MKRCAGKDRRPEPLGYPIVVRQKDPVSERKAKEREQRYNPDPEALRAQSFVAERCLVLCPMVYREWTIAMETCGASVPSMEINK